MLTPSVVTFLALCSTALALNCILSFSADNTVRGEGFISINTMNIYLGSALCKEEFTRCAVVHNMTFGEFRQLAAADGSNFNLGNVDNNSTVNARFCAGPADCSAIKAPSTTGPCSSSSSFDSCCCEGDDCNAGADPNGGFFFQNFFLN